MTARTKTPYIAYLGMTLSLVLALVTGCAKSAEPNQVNEQQVGNVTLTLTDDTAEELLEEMSAFELTALQREEAKENTAGYEPLDAGRGNPNWINAKARYAYTRLMDFATAESELDMSEGDMAGHAQLEGIGVRFDATMDPNNEADAFLIDAVNYCVSELGMNKDDLIYELVNGIVGDYYPSPSRCLTHTEAILNDYLQSTLYDGADL